jgi:hypothetical protein
MKPVVMHPVTMRNDYTHETPPAVTGAVACGVAPLPLLAVYAVVFLIHGSIHPVHPPDITSSTRGELIAGCIAVALIVVLAFGLLWLLNGKRRWPLAILQLASLATFADFVADPTKGGRLVAAVLVLTSVVSLALMFAPSVWWWLDHAAPRWLQAVYGIARRRSAKPQRPAPSEVPEEELAPEQAANLAFDDRLDPVAAAGPSHAGPAGEPATTA